MRNGVMQKVRLPESTIEALKELFNKYFLPEDKLWLFGSRVDLSKKGGDIDLYVETDAASIQAGLKMKTDFLINLERRIGEQKIDLVLNMNNFPYPLPIHEIARAEGVRII